ncbi:hypothetical protein F5Y15DRAFT_396696 [Xylariaceae sp. FL0016]|nr:hypothetical protein F5Y15DRAFT_396696 [Xylariaceae sp. FL0016]
MPKKSLQRHDGPSAAAESDPRFSNFETNPRYRLPSKNRGKTKIDKRFAHMLKDDDFVASAKVDKYGRKLKSDNKVKALRSIYDDDDDDDEQVVQVADDELVQRELEKANKKYDPARGGGFSSSESESDSESDDDEDNEEGGAEVAQSASMSRLRDEQADVEAGDVTRRIAIVNLDWDHIKSTDLMALFSSFAPSTGRVEKVSIYPSEFGKERMQREELEGPPKEIFKKDTKDSEDESDLDTDEEIESEDDEKIKQEILQEGDDQDFDSDALRAYQLDRLRYYYAVMECSDAATAQKIYDSTDGTEYQTSSNFIDLRFIPDNVTFDDEPRDQCDTLSSNYKPNEFTTDALQHSKVQLTWDMHPDEVARREDIKRAFTASRSELEENDLKAYLASDSEDDRGPVAEDDSEQEKELADDQPKLSKKEMKAQKLREALGLGSKPMSKSSSKSGPVGDMQITFSAALTGDSEKQKRDNEEEETTIEKYKRKERERKAKKKEKTVAKRDNAAEKTSADDADDGEEDLGFDDPFFTTEEPIEATKSSKRKEERLKKREEKEAKALEDKLQKEQLKKIMEPMPGEAVDHLDHFNMEEISRAEKLKAKKHKKKGKKQVEDHGGLQEDFKMDPNDDRFNAFFKNHQYAIDPSNPHFKATPGMKQVMEEVRKRKHNPDDLDAPPSSKKSKKQKTQQKNDDLDSLVASIRRKAKK